MALTPGTRLGVYEVTAQIGEGGMGQVYRARDTKLNRDVALKVLPDSFASDPERLARFTREAQTLASLNHPNIAHIHGLEESGGVRALVMELVEGEDLSQRIGRGSIPFDEALPIAKQIVDALEAAHEQGIIHRDLKPANIKVRPDGTVKVLDFGLAKALDPVSSAPYVSRSPTLTTPAMTQAGMILGTAAYMSPEQARGRTVDKRSDMWAFGHVFYEMLTATRAFEGEDLAEMIGAVIHKDPAWSRLPARTPVAVRTVLQRCLQKDSKQRFRDIGDVRLALEGAFDVEPAAAQHMHPAPRRSLWRRLVAFGTATLGVGALAVVADRLATRPSAPRVTRLTITGSGQTALTIGQGTPDIAITPDGSHVVYVGNNGTQLFVRALDALEPVAIETGQALGPFVSPDGQWVGFMDSNLTLKKVAITGGPVIPLAGLGGGLSRGATWLSDGTIIAATDTGLQRISANGGTPTVLTHPDHARGEGNYAWPEALPGGQAVLFTITASTGGLDAASIALFDLRTNTSTILVRGGSDARYAASGHLVYSAAGTLRAVPFDLGRLAVRGPAVPVAPRLVTTTTGAGDFGVATDGTLVYVDAAEDGPRGAPAARTLVWVDRTGKEEPIAGPPRAYEYPRLSPDGTRLAVSISDQEQDIWVWDLRREAPTRLTFDPGRDTYPVWTLDGRRIVFSSPRGSGVPNLWWQAADGTGAADRLTTSPNPQLPTSLSPDGTQLVFYEVTPMMHSDLLRLTLDSTRRVTPLLQTPSDERNGAVSPDGRWLAYDSDSLGRHEVYVRPFPNTTTGQWQVSTEGGTRPLWAHSGKELFFVGADGALLRVPVEATTTWNSGPPAKLLKPGYFVGIAGGTFGRTYDVSPDGQRFLMIKVPDATTAPPNVIVIRHFDEELKRLAPRK